jgi:hypothetical protein
MERDRVGGGYTNFGVLNYCYFKKDTILASVEIVEHFFLCAELVVVYRFKQKVK